jgi:hypothetical protein
VTKRCLDEGIIQSYLDGELSQETTAEVAGHVARCNACADALAEAGSEAALFAASFAPDDSVAVPTEHLRARINAAIAQLEAAPAVSAEKRNGWNFSALFAPFAGLFSFTPQRAAFASLLAIVAFAALFVLVQRRTDVNPGRDRAEIARADTKPTPLPGAPPAVTAPVEVADNSVGDVAGDPNRDEAGDRTGNRSAEVAAVRTVRAEAIGYRGGRARRTAQASRGVGQPAAAPEAEVLLPGEKNYQEAIASLTKAVEVGGDRVMNPQARFEFERNLAVLDRAITETRRAALRDTKDKEAVGFLLAAYQSKVELLTTVADQAQVAALGR